MGSLASKVLDLEDFKKFVLRGNALDMAVGIIIGAAFSKIVESMVKDLMMPVISSITGKGLDFGNLYWVLGPIPDGVTNTLESLIRAGVPVFAYGSFISSVVNFLVLAFCVFQMIRFMNDIAELANLKNQEFRSTNSEEINLLREIRDSLQGGNDPNRKC